MKHIVHHVRSEVNNHLGDYLFLFAGGLFFILSLYYVGQQSRMTSFAIIVAYVAFYIIWGVVHHIKNHTLDLRTVIEYILLGFTVLFLLKLIIIPG